MTEIELAKSIVNLLPAEYQKHMIFALESLKKAEPQDVKYRYKQFAIILHLSLYPNTSEYSEMTKQEFSEWLVWGRKILDKLQHKQSTA